LHGPSGLTNLSDSERALLKAKIKKHVDPKIIAARNKVSAAMRELERGFRAGRAMVEKAAQVAWVEPAPNIRWPR
jgi:hypothetical protein